MGQLRDHGKKKARKEKSNEFPCLAGNHPTYRLESSLTHNTGSKSLPLISLLPLKIPPFYSADLCLRQRPYNITLLRNEDQLLLCKTLTANLHLRDSEDKVTVIMFYPALPKLLPY